MMFVQVQGKKHYKFRLLYSALKKLKLILKEEAE